MDTAKMIPYFDRHNQYGDLLHGLDHVALAASLRLAAEIFV
ncbi:MAG TPA: hypothetical protein VIM64_07150 [Puia sp.]